MAANNKRQRSDSVAVHVALAKKVRQCSPEVDRNTAVEKDKAVILEDEDDTQTPSSFVYATPKPDAQSSTVHFLFFSFEIEERRVVKAWPRAAVREIWAYMMGVPEDEQESKLEELDCIDSFPLVRISHCDEEDIENGEGGKMYDSAIENMKSADDEHSGWQDVILQNEKPDGDAPCLELKLGGEAEDVEDPGRPYHGRWWWVSSQPASTEYELAIEKSDMAGLAVRTGMWFPEGDDNGSEGADGSEEDGA